MINVTEFQAELEKRYPALFKNSNVGLDIGPGWCPTVGQFFDCLQSFYDSAENKIEWGKSVQISQIKEKLGTLRIYYQAPVTSEQREVLQHIINQASLICEICARPGQLKTDNCWLRTRCKTCDSQKISKYST